jgi:peptidoglycan/LPS O-acetylase OafA/YrhL
MFSLDRYKNDTSVMLDLLRAVAAQMVCVGHAINFGGVGYTYLPNDGVLLFFVLSGFLIAYTLDVKSSDPDYTIVEFGIERTSRIYTAYLPALLLIGAATVLARRYGIEMSGDPTDMLTFIGNVTMRQGLPNRWGVSTFGTAGHLTSVAVEFHIYFFVGAIYFFLIKRRVFVCALIALLFSTMPLAYFSNIANSDRALFVLWLLGFASYFIVKSVRDYRYASPFALAAFVICGYIWVAQRTPGDDYNLQQYPMLIFAFFSAVVFSQSIRVIPKRFGLLTTLVADYSFSLFLIHLTIVRIVYALLPEPTCIRIILAVLAANLLSILFAITFERHYRRVARAIKKSTKWAASSLIRTIGTTD